MSVFVLFVGIFSGFFSGLLGLGGGLIMTPMFLYGPSMAGAGALTVKEITRSEEHTSELQSRTNLVCRLLLEKKKKIDNST